MTSNARRPGPLTPVAEDPHAAPQAESRSHSTPNRLTWNGHPQLTPEYQRRRDLATGTHVPKPPPYAAETELALLGAVVTFADRVLEEVIGTGIRPEHFYVPSHRRAWDAVLDQHATGAPVDPHTVAARLGERSTVADAIVAVGDSGPAHAVAWAGVVIDHAHARAMLPALRAAVRAAYDGRTEVVFALMHDALDAGEVAEHECR